MGRANSGSNGSASAPHYGSGGVGGPVPTGQSGSQPGWMQGLSNLRSSLPPGLQEGQGLGGLPTHGGGANPWSPEFEEMLRARRQGIGSRGHNRGGFRNFNPNHGASAQGLGFSPEQMPITTGASVAGTQSSPATTSAPGAQSMTAPSSNTGAQPAPNPAGAPPQGGPSHGSPQELVRALRTRGPHGN